MQVEAIASTISDNFMYYVEDDGDALIVDPVDAATAIDFVRARAPGRVRIFTTHGHPDHAGGNDAVKAALNCRVIASTHAQMFAVPHDEGVSDGDRLTLGGIELAIRWAPGHTDGHVIASYGEHHISGDIYFVGGVGTCKFGGEPGILYNTVCHRLADLDGSARFYPGHDYAQNNLAFCLHVEPGNERAAELKARADRHRREDGPFLLTLDEERAYNPFHRALDPSLQEHIAGRFSELSDDSVEDAGERCFRTLRSLRDNW